MYLSLKTGDTNDEEPQFFRHTHSYGGARGDPRGDDTSGVVQDIRRAFAPDRHMETSGGRESDSIYETSERG